MSLSIIHHAVCPVCHSRQIGEVLVCKDFTVSHQSFSIWECQSCSVRFTQQAPAKESIGPYYASDNYISHSDTSKGLISKLYKIARQYTLAQKVKNIRNLSGMAAAALLDVGCGTGAFAHAMQAAGWQVEALEPDAGARTKAFELYQLQARGIEHLYELPSAAYDVITLWHVLEHVHDLHPFFEQFARLLKPNGVLVIAVPNYTSKDAATYQSFWAAYDVPRHLYHFSPQSMGVLAQKHAFGVDKVQPMWLDAFYIALLSEQYQHGKQRIWQACLAGWRSVMAARKKPGTCSSQVYVLKKWAGK
jgi:SAM-dependent methyltransferase